jgi:hypothetical protein
MTGFFAVVLAMAYLTILNALPVQFSVANSLKLKLAMMHTQVQHDVRKDFGYPYDIEGTWIPLNDTTFTSNAANVTIGTDHVCRGKMKVGTEMEYTAGWPMKDSKTKNWQCMVALNHTIEATQGNVEILVSNKNYTWEFNSTNIPVVIAGLINTTSVVYPICKPKHNFQFIGMLHGDECCYNFAINGTEHCENKFHLISISPLSPIKP